MKTKLYRPTPQNIQLLAGMLQRGLPVGAPTETVYGLAANALDAAACAGIFTAKGRPANDPLIVHVLNRTQARTLCDWNEAATKLAAAFWPGPLTLVLPKKSAVPDIVTSGLPSVAIRCPQHPVFRALLKAAGCPLAAPSANRFGYVSPTTAAHVRDGLDGRIPAVLDAGECAIGLESTIVDIRDPAHPRLLRPGAISAERIRAVLGIASFGRRASTVSARVAAVAPGLLKRHYSPRARLTLHATLRPPRTPRAATATVLFGPARPELVAQPHVFVLAADGRGATAAHHLFSLLRQLDRLGYESIRLQKPPATDEWAEALLDRMQRAAAK